MADELLEFLLGDEYLRCRVEILNTWGWHFRAWSDLSPLVERVLYVQGQGPGAPGCPPAVVNGCAGVRAGEPAPLPGDVFKTLWLTVSLALDWERENGKLRS